MSASDDSANGEEDEEGTADKTSMREDAGAGKAGQNHGGGRPLGIGGSVAGQATRHAGKADEQSWRQGGHQPLPNQSKPDEERAANDQETIGRSSRTRRLKGGRVSN